MIVRASPFLYTNSYICFHFTIKTALQQVSLETFHRIFCYPRASVHGKHKKGFPFTQEALLLNGADDQDWTGDLILTKDTLCRLSYISIWNWLRGADLNHRPSGYEPDELPTAPPRDEWLVERVGFEPTKRNAADLQSAPFSHSGTSPFATRKIIQDLWLFVNRLSQFFIIWLELF